MQLLEELLRLAEENGSFDDRRLRGALAQAYVEIRLFQLHNLRSVSRLSHGLEPGPEGSALEAVLERDVETLSRDGHGRPG